MEIERTILVCVIVVLMLVVYFGTIRPAREEAACMAYVRREWHGKLPRPGPTFREGDRVRAIDWDRVDGEDGRGTVVGVAVERAPDGVEYPVYWVLYDSFVREMGDDARALRMAACELEPEEKVA